MEKEMLLAKKKYKLKKDIPRIENDSLQYNSQDLDQEQRVDVKPLQLNTQNLHITLSNDITDYSGKITGITYLAKNKEIASNVNIFLFFGNESRHPVCKTDSDKNGKYIFEDLPPGYYSLFARYGDYSKFETYSIKVLPCQIVDQSILLK